MAEHWCINCGHVWVERKGDKCQRCKDIERAEKIPVYVDKNEGLRHHDKGGDRHQGNRDGHVRER